MKLIRLMLLLFLAGCSLDLGNTSSEDEDNDITNIDNSISGAASGDARLCQGVLSIDGEGGFLWKPESASDGNLVVLFPEEFDTEFISVLAQRPSGSVEEGTFSGFTNGNRQTWRFENPGGTYTGKLIVDAGTQECVWLVSDPGEVQD